MTGPPQIFRWITLLAGTLLVLGGEGVEEAQAQQTREGARVSIHVPTISFVRPTQQTLTLAQTATGEPTVVDGRVAVRHGGNVSYRVAIGRQGNQEPRVEWRVVGQEGWNSLSARTVLPKVFEPGQRPGPELEFRIQPGYDAGPIPSTIELRFVAFPAHRAREADRQDRDEAPGAVPGGHHNE